MAPGEPANIKRGVDAMKKLQERNAILTGASRGIGSHIALALAGEGINLALVARSADALEEVREKVLSLGVKAVTIPTDLAETAQVEALPEEAERKLGPVDILVNNAGVEHTSPYEEYPREKIYAAVNINLLASMLLTHAVLPGMLARGRGHIVNMSSLAGKIGLPYQTPYATTKAGLIMFTHSLRAELMDKAVGVSVICPGFVADDGMYVRRENSGESAPAAMKPTTMKKVVTAVIDAIKQNTPERIVNPLPMRPMTALRELIPGIMPRVHKVLGITDFTRKMSKLMLTVCQLAFLIGLIAFGVPSTTAYADLNEKVPYTLHEVTAPDGVTLSVQEWDNADWPAILFIHGYAQSHLVTWQPSSRAWNLWIR
jgi:short-subunit dehydrogenase